MGLSYLCAVLILHGCTRQVQPCCNWSKLAGFLSSTSGIWHTAYCSLALDVSLRWGLWEYLCKTGAQVSKVCPQLPPGLFSAGDSAEGCVLHSALCARPIAKAQRRAVAHAVCHSCQSISEVPWQLFAQGPVSLPSMFWYHHYIVMVPKFKLSLQLQFLNLKMFLRLGCRHHSHPPAGNMQKYRLKFDWKCFMQLILCRESCSGSSFLWKHQKAVVNRSGGCLGPCTMLGHSGGSKRL